MATKTRTKFKKVEDYKLSKFVFSAFDLSNISARGVYKIYHITDPDKVYIGCTFHKTRSSFIGGFYTRWCCHIRMLINKKHSSTSLQNFVNENGVDGIRFSILEICTDKEIAFKTEKNYIGLIKPFHNIVPAEVYQFDLKGKMIRKYMSGTDAANKTGIDRASINNTCLGNRYSAGGFLWSFKENVQPKRRSMTNQICLTSGKVLKRYYTSRQAAKAMGTCSTTSIRCVINGKQKQAYGYFWSRSPE